MYMCRETLRRAVVQAFNDRKGWDCQTFDELYNRIQDKAEANEIINGLKICDPSVGSGHFLVSALNELIAIKSDLEILCDEQGRALRDYSVRVESDELVITDEDGELFSYRPKNVKSLRVQKTLFEEKRRIIENCLFGVDINPNSVSICRLRLWIELLKHAYYTDSETRILETLPNIDINIKPGNSVISRYPIELDIQPLLKKAGYTIEQYREAVQAYREAVLKDEKWELERFIQQLKMDLRSEISAENPLLAKRAEKEKAWQELRQAIIVSTGDAVRDRRDRELRNQRDAKLKREIEALTEQIEAEKSGLIFRTALEWRFEFPEVLDAEGNFIGFDVIIGNPPYVRQEEIKAFKPYLKELFSTYTGVADLFVYFYELGLRLLKPGGYLTFISSNKYFRAGYGEKLRRLLAEETTIANLIDFGDFPVFEEAIAYPSIITLRKVKPAADQVVRALSWDGSKLGDVKEFGAVLGSSGLDLRTGGADGGWLAVG
ncbi:MAG: class I SAM-dependent DNA methyltransferase, partial [Coleofasciculaceae cyanobacterium RL_1_1]|nr:class I SAM-dependent DNA methyltransferase [Coleofasciculaceae cyanobacterium RL_1_1]